MRVVLVGLVAGACLAACGGGGKSGPVTGSVTYYKDVLPLVSAHCGGCHVSGGFAPFSLTSYDEARGYAALAEAATKSGEMPPWFYILPFHPDAKLSAADKALLKSYFLKNKKSEEKPKADGAEVAGSANKAEPKKGE